MGYIEQAFKYNHEFWRYIVGFLVVFIGSQLVGSMPLMMAVAIKTMQNGGLELTNTMDIFSAFEPNIMLLFLLFPFVIGFLGLKLWMKPMHNQPFRTLNNVSGKLNWKKVFFAFFLWASVSIVLMVTDYFLNPEDYELNFKFGPFLLLLLLVIVLMPLQTSFEEYMFRGYLMQGIGALAKNRWVPLVTTSVIFGLMHLGNPEIGKIGYIAIIAYLGSGFFLGIITLMDEGLELALGFHAANNMVTALLVTADWTAFQTHSIFKDVSDPNVGLEVFLPVLVIYPILIAIFAKKYKWYQWKEKLTGKVYPPTEIGQIGEGA